MLSAFAAVLLRCLPSLLWLNKPCGRRSGSTSQWLQKPQAATSGSLCTCTYALKKLTAPPAIDFNSPAQPVNALDVGKSTQRVRNLCCMITSADGCAGRRQVYIIRRRIWPRMRRPRNVRLRKLHALHAGRRLMVMTLGQSRRT